MKHILSVNIFVKCDYGVLLSVIKNPLKQHTANHRTLLIDKINVIKVHVNHITDVFC